MRNTRGRLVIALITALVAIVSYFMKTSTNEITGETQRVSLSPEQEVALGIQAAPQMAAQYGGLSQDRQALATVQRVGQRLVQRTEASRSRYQYNFYLLADNQTVNAFALPGGQIFITEALYRRLRTEDQLAGVLGHEIGHVIGRHSAEQMAQQELAQGLSNAAAVAASDPNNPQGAAYISQMVGQMVLMKYGREDELESDNFGVKYMSQAGYDPHALIEVMLILKQASGGKSQPEFMSTHPDPENRVEHIKAAIEKMQTPQ
jgi:predicted Zn-dependent protease